MMKMIHKLSFDGQSDEAIAFYQKVFGCQIRTLMHRSDAVKNGWEQPCPEQDHLVYHSEVMFGEQEVRFADICSDEDRELTQRYEMILGFDTAEEVESAFAILAQDGLVIRPLERPPFMVIIGTVRDKFGIKWTLMCDWS